MHTDDLRAALHGAQTKYAASIRNEAKRKYALDCIRFSRSGIDYPPSPEGLSVMAAQAVRMQLNALRATWSTESKELNHLPRQENV